MRHGSLTAAPPRPPRPHSLVHDAESKDADLPSLLASQTCPKGGWCQKYARAENVALTHFLTIIYIYIYIHTFPSCFLARFRKLFLRFPRRGALNSFIGDQKRQTVTIRRRETVDEHATKIPLFFSPLSVPILFKHLEDGKLFDCAEYTHTHTPDYLSVGRSNNTGSRLSALDACTLQRRQGRKPGIGDLLRMAMGNNCAFALVAGGGFHGRLHDSR